MNLFKTTDNGGLPLVLNDFRWIDAGYREAFKAIMSSYGIDDSMTVILNGCERNVVSGTVTISEGYVSLGGEICFVPEHSYADPVGTFEYWDLNLSFDADGYKTFQSTSNFETYQRRIAKITVASSIPPGYSEYSATENVFEIIRRKIPRDAWNQFKNYTVPPSDYFPGVYSLECKLDFDGFVHLQGLQVFEDLADGAINVLIGTLPVGYRPSKTVTRLISNMNSSVIIGQTLIEIATNGEIRAKVVKDLAFAERWDLDQITPFEAVV